MTFGGNNSNLHHTFVIANAFRITFFQTLECRPHVCPRDTPLSSKQLKRPHQARSLFAGANLSIRPQLTLEQSQPLVRNPLQTHWRAVLGGGSAPEPRAIYLCRIGCCLSFGSYNANLSSQISVLTVARVHLGNCWGAVCVSLRFPTDAESLSPDWWVPY